MKKQVIAIGLDPAEPKLIEQSMSKGHLPNLRRIRQQDIYGPLSLYPLMEQKVELSWMPTLWYSSLWSEMKAFALPAFADGHIRINLKECDRNGIVEPLKYL